MAELSEQQMKDAELIRTSPLFDSDWYLTTYPDVRALGMDPAEHYLKYGTLLRRDPGPGFSTGFYLDTRGGVARQGLNPLVHAVTRKKPTPPNADNILWSANLQAMRFGYDHGVALAEANLPPALAHTSAILKANAMLARGSEEGWLSHLNAYLAHFEISPLRLTGEGSLLSRLSTDALPQITGGPCVSVIMPAWNAETTVTAAARSILNQTWQNVELLIVDDCSTDGTWSVLQQIAASDSRVKIRRNVQNVGPYVSKNIALTGATGKYVTGHDADDWAHPQRLENHLKVALSAGGPRASLTYMLRIKPDGHLGHVGKITGFSFDGAARKASISCLFERDFLKTTVGFWDSVRFGADSEMIARTEAVLGAEFQNVRQIGMICLDLEDSLTNDPVHGIRANNGGLADSRKNYRDSWSTWIKDNLPGKPAFLDFPQKSRRYDAAPEMVADVAAVAANSSVV